MKIRNHRLVGHALGNVNFTASPNIGSVIQPRYLVIHYTAGSSAAGSISWLQNLASKVSAHLVIARDGTITQMVPFNRIAQHAGPSRWGSIVGLNRHSIGIELDNAGQLNRSGGKWVSPVSRRSYPDADVTVAPYRNDPPGNAPCGWHAYTEAQLHATLEASLTLASHYALINVLGHDDIAPTRKRDPGPDFPMASFRARVMGPPLSSRQCCQFSCCTKFIGEENENISMANNSGGVGHRRLGVDIAATRVRACRRIQARRCAHTDSQHIRYRQRRWLPRR